MLDTTQFMIVHPFTIINNTCFSLFAPIYIKLTISQYLIRVYHHSRVKYIHNDPVIKK
jgi:hypothetical protein